MEGPVFFKDLRLFWSKYGHLYVTITILLVEDSLMKTFANPLWTTLFPNIYITGVSWQERNDVVFCQTIRIVPPLVIWRQVETQLMASQWGFFWPCGRSWARFFSKYFKVASSKGHGTTNLRKYYDHAGEKGDQTLIGKGLTLLNCALKILAKLYQLRLTKVLQGFINEQQSACMLGRSIHRALFLTNEVLHKAKEADLSILLLKLDTIIKAFNNIGWEFLYRLLQKIGFGPNFLKVIQAINASVSSAILLNDKLTATFPLRRSLTQGYPLSLLLFLIVVNALNILLTQAADQGRIRGVYISETDKQITHGQFMDDTNVIIKAKREYVIEAMFEVFRKMRRVSGLNIKYDGMKAVLVSNQQLPHELEDLN